jgi:uncharacterized membrane protein YkoI
MHQHRVSRPRYADRMTQLRSSRTARRFSLGLAAAAIVGSAAFIPTVPAKAGDNDKEARRNQELREIRTAVSRGQVLPLPRIIAIAQGRVKGDMVKIEIEKENGVLIYEVKILTAKGRVREVELDARTGAILSVEDD